MVDRLSAIRPAVVAASRFVMPPHWGVGAPSLAAPKVKEMMRVSARRIAAGWSQSAARVAALRSYSTDPEGMISPVPRLGPTRGHAVQAAAT